MPDGGIDGLIVVDKPAGLTSHDVVARVRRLAGTRKVGHAGTLDPMATGVLVLGLGRATRLLGYVSGADKAYSATVRFGQATDTDDAEGTLVSGSSAQDIDLEDVRGVAQRFVGDIEQVPSSVSAIKVGGERAYAKTRRGEEVSLPARPVSITEIEVTRPTRPTAELLDVDVDVVCSSGTYIRALARDMGERLGVGAHLTRLRRTRVGAFGIEGATTLDELAESVTLIELDHAVSVVFPRRDVAADDATLVRHGRPLELADENGPTGVFGPDGHVLAVMAPADGVLRVVVGLVG